ncbi:4'-phosphopantetheinyl transferase [Limtongia smithiae]|uniref:4'-phosphopantetheinyl transferase n=1 Tax=Limtongia smithiae TaxID=1125753 RepID=UPI0034CFBF41
MPTTLRAVGVDILHIPRIADVLARTPFSARRFPTRVLHAYELARYNALREKSPEAATLFVARCWAIKEAVFKTLDDVEQREFAFKSWRTITNTHPRPVAVHDSGSGDFLVSVSHDGEYLVAFVSRTHTPP